MQSFEANRPYIENEFEQAVFDPATGLSAEALMDGLSPDPWFAQRLFPIFWTMCSCS